MIIFLKKNYYSHFYLIKFKISHSNFLIYTTKLHPLEFLLKTDEKERLNAFT